MNNEPKEIKMIVGLGNPGRDYIHTRHNAGFRTVDALAHRHHVTYWKDQLGAEVAKAEIGGREILLVKPQSFMNLSGGPVSKLCREYKIKPDEVLVVHDELDIDEGTVRVKFGGGHGGHNGLRSIIDKFEGNRNFSRVRFGIGRPPGNMPVADFVLRQLKGAQAEEFDFTVQEAADVCEMCVTKGVVAARDYYNAKAKA